MLLGPSFHYGRGAQQPFSYHRDATTVRERLRRQVYLRESMMGTGTFLELQFQDQHKELISWTKRGKVEWDREATAYASSVELESPIVAAHHV